MDEILAIKSSEQRTLASVIQELLRLGLGVRRQRGDLAAVTPAAGSPVDAANPTTQEG